LERGSGDRRRNTRTDRNGTLVADQILAASLSGRAKYDDSINVLQSVYAASPMQLSR